MATFPPWTGFNFTKTLHSSPSAALLAEQSLPTPFVACITGASRGIGAATAKAFAKAGAIGLILTARTEEALEEVKRECLAVAEKRDLKVSVVGADVGDEDDVKRLREVVDREYGRLDVLVNNAGLVSTDASAFGRLADIGLRQIQDTMQANYVGKFLTAKHLLPLLLASPGGAKAIVNVTSLSSHFAAEGAVGFNVSALAISRLTENIAEAYSGEGVVAYAVHPGMVLTTPPPGMPKEWVGGMRDKVGLCGAFLVWLVRERRGWLSGRYVSANWDVGELVGMREGIVQGDKLKMRMVV